ncbi:MAG TPA: glycosyl hydrolase [Paludibaculum sp.]|jgi:hypothetical protein
MKARTGLLLAFLLITCVLLAQNTTPTLEQGFQNPPDSAKPRVWWHWMNGNITKEGIQADLEWMKRVGIGGFQNFDASMNTPKIVDKRLVYMTPEWKDAFQFTAKLADQLGLEMAIAGSPGWSESGGPWVPPAQGMKKYTWSETRIEGGKPFTGALPKPPGVTGPFQNAPGSGGLLGGEGPKVEYAADVAVVAFRTPAAAPQPKITPSAGTIQASLLSDGNLQTSVSLPAAPVGEQAWIDFDFGTPQAIRSYSYATGGPINRMAIFFGGSPGPELLASDDGRQFRPVARVSIGVVPQSTVSFPEVRARYFRVTFVTPKPMTGFPGMDMDLGDVVDVNAMSKPITEHKVAELVLSAAPRINRFEDKAAFAPTMELFALATPPAAGIDKSDVIDLTAKMRPDGTLDWTPPPGLWTVLRMGQSLLGIQNHPASPEATGLEVDKLSRPAVRAYLENYLNQYKSATGGLMGKRGLGYVITDSWEAGAQNWTDDMMAQFAKRRGYEMKPWLPALAGYIVVSAEASDKFLYDFRKTIAELTAENHYDQMTEILHPLGMGRYSESHETNRALIADGMAVKRTADVPMSAMWTGRPGPLGVNPGSAADIRESASVAHIYGQNLVAAESLTAAGGAYTFSPETLKPTADAELSQGLNRFVIHTSVHQPVTEKRPGLSLGPFGQWFTRLETWGELAKPWTTYLARSCYLLQQGKFVADVVYYYGEDSNVTALFGNAGPDIPASYNFDYANSDVLLNRLSVANGRLTTTTGMSYRVLALDVNARQMPLAVLRKIRDLVNAGAVVVGPKPAGSPSLSDDQAEVRQLADQLWDSGKVRSGKKIGEVLAELRVAPDFEYTKPQPDTAVLFVHRKLADGDLYWVNNRQKRAESFEGTFRVTGKAPEIWHPDTGLVEPVSYRIADGKTIAALRMEANDAYFVVFRKASNATSRTAPSMTETQVGTLDGAWNVAFQPERGAPARITLDKLASWSESADKGVKYFSGTATYTKTVDAPADWFKTGAQVWLDLGDVKNLAEVSVNGKPLGILWRAPFRANVTGTLKAGANSLEIKVTNLWVNRIIGDKQPGEEKKYAYTSQRFHRPTTPLLPSGLLGPVKVVRLAH